MKSLLMCLKASFSFLPFSQIVVGIENNGDFFFSLFKIRSIPFHRNVCVYVKIELFRLKSC